MKQIKITLPLDENIVQSLKAGDRILLNGYIYTARDAAHQKMVDEYEKKEKFPVDLKNETIYYVGPCPNKPDEIIGSAGPTTSSRMDKYTPLLIKHGLKGMIGKGFRDEKVISSMKTYKAVYFGAIGGTSALLKKCIKESQIIAYEDLGTEAIRRLYIEDFPVIVVIDSNGNNLYESEYKKYCKVSG